MTVLSEDERRAIVGGDPHERYELVDEHNIGMDSHGCNVVVAVLSDIDGPHLVGFVYRYNSEASYYDDSGELITVTAREVTKTVYDRADGTYWWDHL